MHTFCDTWRQLKDHKKTFDVLLGKFHDQGDAKRIVIRGQLKGHFRWPTPGRPIGRLVVGFPQGVFGGLSYYWLIICFFNIVPLIMEFTSEVTKHNKNVTKKECCVFHLGTKPWQTCSPIIISQYDQISYHSAWYAISSKVKPEMGEQCHFIKSLQYHYNIITISLQYHCNFILGIF